jgi:uncharacterized protein
VTTPFPGEMVPPRTPPPLPGPVLLAQTWRDIVFVHWPVDPTSVRELFPDRTRPDTFGGRTYVGIVGFSIPSTRVGGVIPIGPTYEVNVRLYSIDDQGRQGVVFLAMEVTRPDMVLAGHALLRLPYSWSDIEPIPPDPTAAGYRIRRRIPSRHLAAQVAIDIAGSMNQPSPLQVFLTARWGLHTRTTLGTTWIPIAHPPFPLRSARVRQADYELLAEAGVLPPSDSPIGVMWSPRVDAQVGRPTRVHPPKAGY